MMAIIGRALARMLAHLSYWVSRVKSYHGALRMKQETREENAGQGNNAAMPPSAGQNLISLLDQITIEHGTLRKEIEAAKVWEVRLLVGGLIGFPAAFEWARTTDASNHLYYIACFLPVGILVLSLLVAFVRWSAMRCGQYIREELEPHFPLVGWETWREKKKARRRSEVLLANAYLILVSAFYIVAAWIGFDHVISQPPYASLTLFSVGSIYLIGFFLTVVFAWTPISTDQTDLDSTPLAKLADFFRKARGVD